MTKTEQKVLKSFIREWEERLDDPYFKKTELSQYQKGVLVGSVMIINELKTLFKRFKRK